MNVSASANPLQVLGLSGQVGDDEIRARYLELVKQFPPDREPDKFREIRAAYEAIRDPLVIARRLIEPPDDESPPSWTEVINAHKSIPPPLSPAFLLSLGNRDDANAAAQASGSPSDAGSSEHGTS